MDVAERLAALRKRARLSQGDVAERLNVSRQAVSRWETGFTVPSTDNLSHLGRLYGVTLDELLSYSAPLPPEKPREKSTEEALAEQPTEAAQQPTEEAAAQQPAANSVPAHARAIIIALSILCLLLAIGAGVLLYQKYSVNRELTFDEIESESIEDADIDEFQFG